MMKKILKISIASFIILSLILVFLLTTQAGLGLSYYVAKAFTPGNIHLHTLEGRLIGPIKIQALTYTNSNVEVQASTIKLNWKPRYLLKGTLDISKLIANGVIVTLKTDSIPTDTSASAATEHDPIKLPIAIHLERVKLTQFILKDNPDSTLLSLKNFSSKTSLSQNKQDILLSSSNRWSNLQVNITDKKSIISKQGALNVYGPLSNYYLQASQYLVATDLPESIWQIEGRGDSQGIKFRKLQIQILGGRIYSHGNIAWLPTLNWHLDTLARNLQLQQYNKQLSGNVAFKLNSQGNLATDDYHIDVKLEKLQGNVKKYPIHGQGEVLLKNHYLHIKQVDLKLGNASIQANGLLNKRWQLQWQAHLPKLSAFTSHLQGAINSQGTLSGSAEDPILKTLTTINNLAYEGNHISSLQTQLNLHLLSSQRSQLTLQAIDIVAAGININNVSVNAHGNRQHQAIDLKLQQGQQKLTTRIQGQLDQQQWSAQIKQFNFDEPQFGLWKLSQTAMLKLSKEQASLSDFCLHSQHGKVCTNGHWVDQQGWRANLTIQNFPLASLAGFINPELKISNKLQANIHAQSKLQQAASDKDHKNTAKTDSISALTEPTITANMDLQLSPGELSYPLENTRHTLTITGGHMTATLDKAGLKSQLKLQLQGQQPITASLQLPKFSPATLNRNTQKIVGKINFRLNDLSILSVIVPQISDPEGQLASHITLQGTLTEPQILGQINLNNGQVNINQTGVKLRNINLQAKGHNQQPITFSGSARSGPGTINLSGSADVFSSPMTVKVQVKGDNVEVFNTQDGTVYASPDLLFNIVDTRIDLTGSIYIPKATITPEDFSSTVTLPKDVVYVKNNQVEDQSSIEFYSDVHLRLSKDIHLSFMGLDAELTGDLKLKDTPGGVTTAIGDLTVVKGHYTAYGQDLSVSNGRLLFAGGPVTNPGLNIKAVRAINSISLVDENDRSSDSHAVSSSRELVGIQVLGTLETPKITLFSQPPGMSQSEILSALVLGRSPNHGSSSDAQMLLGAMSALNAGTSATSNLKKEITSTLGLDELSLGSEEQYNPETNTVEENTALMLGKALSPKLFIDYSIGLINPINTLHIRYKVTNRWTLQSSSSTYENGIDLFYTIEKD